MLLSLNPPDWNNIVGGTVETSWIADRHRKLGIATTISEEIERVFLSMKGRKELFEATPEALLSDRFAGQWYLSLAGFSQKTLVNTVEAPKKFGMTQKPASLVESLAEQANRMRMGEITAKQIPMKMRHNLRAFADWINYELKSALAEDQRTPERALIRVSLLLGGRIIGQGQNEGGNEGVVLVKELLYRGLSRKHRVQIRAEGDGTWQQDPDPSALANAVSIKFGDRMECDFTSGGNRPDLKIVVDGQIIAVGEIKARKDLSNLWESWMPQVAGHMKTWYSEFPDAARMFFGTVITDDMINGISRRGTLHTGLRELFRIGHLTAVYNLSHIVNFDLNTQSGLRNLVESLSLALDGV